MQAARQKLRRRENFRSEREPIPKMRCRAARPERNAAPEATLFRHIEPVQSLGVAFGYLRTKQVSDSRSSEA